jgi:hypothetical protein
MFILSRVCLTSHGITAGYIIPVPGPPGQRRSVTVFSPHRRRDLCTIVLFCYSLIFTIDEVIL